MIIQRDDSTEEFRITDPQSGEEGDWFDYGCLGWLKVGEKLYVAEPTGAGELAEDTVYEVTPVGTSVEKAEPEDEDEGDEGDEEDEEDEAEAGAHPAD